MKTHLIYKRLDQSVSVCNILKYIPEEYKGEEISIFALAPSSHEPNHLYYGLFWRQAKLLQTKAAVLRVCGSQVRSEGFAGVDDRVGGDVLLTVRLPERTELGPHVPALVVDVLVAWRHLLDRVDVNIDVRGGVSGVKHLAEGQNEAACGVLGKSKAMTTTVG